MNAIQTPLGGPNQLDMFSDNEAPVLAACGMGVDSVAMIIEMVESGQRIDAVLFADTGSEKPETYRFIPLFAEYLRKHDLPFEIVRYQPTDFKNYPPYRTLEENCLTNGTLPSKAFGFGSCSQKWKVAPQNKWAESWEPARRCWASGGRVTKLIGYDCSPADNKRYADREGYDDPKYVYRYPLREWGWKREHCIARIEQSELPVPVKSACFFCPVMKPHEVDELSKPLLRRIVLMEARAKPRLRNVEGLWRKPTKGMRGAVAKPGSITQYILEKGLLTHNEVEAISAETPANLLRFQDAQAPLNLKDREDLQTFLDRFNNHFSNAMSDSDISNLYS